MIFNWSISKFITQDEILALSSLFFYFFIYNNTEFSEKIPNQQIYQLTITNDHIFSNFYLTMHLPKNYSADCIMIIPLHSTSNIFWEISENITNSSTNLNKLLYFYSTPKRTWNSSVLICLASQASWRDSFENAWLWELPYLVCNNYIFF